MSASRVRLILCWVAVGAIMSACAARGTSPGEQTTNALLITGISGLAILVLLLVSRWVAKKDWSASNKGAIIGFLFGLIIAAVIIRRVPLETQLLFIGAVLGVGSDFIATIKEPAGPKTSINSLARLIVNTARAILGAAKLSKIDAPEYSVVTAGLWAIIGTIAFTLIVGNLF